MERGLSLSLPTRRGDRDLPKMKQIFENIFLQYWKGVWVLPKEGQGNFPASKNRHEKWLS